MCIWCLIFSFSDNCKKYLTTNDNLITELGKFWPNERYLSISLSLVYPIRLILPLASAEILSQSDLFFCQSLLSLCPFLACLFILVRIYVN